MAINTPATFLSNIVRKEIMDIVTPYLWSDDELYEYMNEAQREFARETKCIPDSNTYVDIPYSDEWIEFDPEIIEIKRAVADGEKVLDIMTLEEFSDETWVDDYGYRKKAVWENDTGDPTHLIINMESNEARLYPIPSTSGTVDLFVWREPLLTLDSDSSSFEIPERFIYRLIYKIKELAYSKQDYETFDGDKAITNRALWIDSLFDAQSKIKKRARKPRRIMYGGL